MPNWISKISLPYVETHISWIFLDHEFVYKAKKPVDFGFCNFTTLDLRRKFCEREVLKNRALSPDIYLGVLPVYFDGSQVSFGEGSGELVDYCVKMVRLPEDRKMSELLLRGEVSEDDVAKIAKIVRDFHDRLPVAGRAEKIREFCVQNFEQTLEYVGRAVSREDFEFIKIRTLKFLENFPARPEHVKDCHGDLHSGNIFILENGDVKIFDALEFNEDLSTTDTLSDVAFMAMDLEFHGRDDLAAEFVTAYGEKSGHLLNFYKCYRAYVRGKVACFSSDFQKAGKYFELAKKYVSVM